MFGHRLNKVQSSPVTNVNNTTDTGKNLALPLLFFLLLAILPAFNAPLDAIKHANMLNFTGTLESLSEKKHYPLGEYGNYYLPQYEEALFELVNEARLEHNLPAYKFDLRLVDFAREKGEDLLTYGYIEHNSPRLGRPGQQASRNGIAFSSYGENLAGTLEAGDLDPEMAFHHLMESKYHRGAILCNKKKFLGIGVARGSEKGIVYVMHFMSP